jgi:hypothetical protein
MDGNLIKKQIIGCHRVSKMTKETILIQKDRLGFLSVAKTFFKFLESYGFEIVQEDIGFLRYENTLYYINICHGRLSYEVHIEVGPKDSEDELYHLEDIIGITDPIKSENYFRPMANTPMSLYKFVEMHAQMLKQYGENILKGDSYTWDKLRKCHEEKVTEYWNDKIKKEIQEKAKIAFREKRYNDFIKLYEGIETELTKLERKKLEYAKSRIIR